MGIFAKACYYRLILIGLPAILFTVYAKAQAQVFAVDHNGVTAIFTNLDTAITNAQTGDAIYLPGGIINFSGTIRKGVNLVGAGFFPDSTVATSQTIIVPAVFIKNGASNFSVSGVFFQSNVSVDSCTNVLFSRCRIGATYTSTKSQRYIIKWMRA